MVPELIGLLIRHGPLLVFSNVLAKQVGLPIPALPTLIVAGALAADGKLSYGSAFSAAILASLLGDTIWYCAGRVYGYRVMRVICRLSLSPDSCVRQTEVRFERWGVRALAVSNFIPGLSIIAAPMAGALRWPWPLFALFDVLGAGLWAATGLCVGSLLHLDIERLVSLLQSVGAQGSLFLAALLLGYVGFKWFERKRFYRLLRMARITVGELNQLMIAGAEPVVVDVRSASARALDPRSVPGARSFDPATLDNHVHTLPTDRDIVLYCLCPNEASAAQVAKLLIDRGFTRVRPLLGGLDAWVEAGYPVQNTSLPD